MERQICFCSLSQMIRMYFSKCVSQENCLDSSVSWLHQPSLFAGSFLGHHCLVAILLLTSLAAAFVALWMQRLFSSDAYMYSNILTTDLNVVLKKESRHSGYAYICYSGLPGMFDLDLLQQIKKKKCIKCTFLIQHILEQNSIYMWRSSVIFCF